MSSTVPQSTVPGFLERVRNLLASLPPANRPQFAEFWAFVRGRIRDFEQQIQHLLLQKLVLEQELEATKVRLNAAQETIDDLLLKSQKSASRPATSASVDQLRFDLQDLMDAEFGDLHEVSETVESIWDLDPAWVHSKLNADREAAVEAQDSRARQLGCWLRRADSNHEYGYTKVNLRNTFRPGSRTRIGCQPFRHQLAVVAAGFGQNLLRTSAPDGTDEVSHLCLNPRCFNPDHVIVESKEINRKRWSCGGAWAVRAADGTVYYPCPHGGEEHGRQCLLPRSQLQAHRYYENSSLGPRLRE